MFAKLKATIGGGCLVCMLSVAAVAGPQVVVSVKPVHSLVAGVMEGVGRPELVVSGAASPHTFALKPSQVQMLSSADMIYWVGSGFETGMEKALQTVAPDARAIALIDVAGVRGLAYRGEDDFLKVAQEGHDAHAHADDHAHDEDHAHEEEHTHGHDHEHGGIDPHIWLDPLNARAMVDHIAKTLAEADPDNAETYGRNAKAMAVRLDKLVHEIEAQISPVRGEPFIVFHDAYQYFESRFGLQAAGTLKLSPEVMPGAGHLARMREKIKVLGAVCIFTEPQFESSLVATVKDGTQARSAEVDPLGAELDEGPALYFELLRNMASVFRSCLGGRTQ